MELRGYQRECIETIQAQPPGSYLIQIPTGGGKTVIFTSIPRRGRVLVLAHREELCRQPAKYYDCPVGFEIREETSHGEEVVIASIQSLVNRLEKFKSDDFDMIITDESHHSVAATYQKIYAHFTPRLHLGFTATSNRGDHVRLDTVFSRIIFQRDLVWAIKSGYLTDIYCRRANIGYDLSKVHSRDGDFAPGELDKAMDGTADAIAQAYRELATGATLIFAVSVNQAKQIAERIPGAVVVTGKTQNRAQIIRDFTERKIPCLVNCMIFTEGTDIPLIESIIIARPTQSESLFCQMVGRGLRLYPGKDKLNLIDCVGVTGTKSLCTAPTLLGLNMDAVPAESRDKIEGDLFELPLKIAAASDTPQSWIKNVQIVDLWRKNAGYDTHGVNFFLHADGVMTCSIPGMKYVIPPPDALGNVWFNRQEMLLQQAIDLVFVDLRDNHGDAIKLWDVKKIKNGWGREPASDRQKELISKRNLPGIDCNKLTKYQAGQILSRIFDGKKIPRRRTRRATAAV